MRLNSTLEMQRASADRDVNDVARDSRKSVARLQQELDLARQRGACVPTTIRPTRRGRNSLRGKFVAHSTRGRPQRAVTKVVFSQCVKFHVRDSRTRTMPDADLGPPAGHRQCPQRGRLGQGWCAGRLVARGHSAKGGPYPVRAPSMRRDEKWSRPPIDPGGRGLPGDPTPCVTLPCERHRPLAESRVLLPRAVRARAMSSGLVSGRRLSARCRLWGRVRRSLGPERGTSDRCRRGQVARAPTAYRHGARASLRVPMSGAAP